MPPRTGPAVVSLEMVVLPAQLDVLPQRPDINVSVLVPTCRYGVATYGAYLTRKGRLPGSKRRINWLEVPQRIQSGASFLVRIPPGWEGAEIRLRLQRITLSPGALLELTDDELIEALSHPLDRVREAAFLAVQRPRSKP